ncbi:hypothetical protein U9M48_014923 [Paspalum notatum var. saurae]|uniref:Uncharacterized protein n=1 Tax=Paspalum notatum var. saurae TaxID=547442 RepID=A0AAQ3T3U1_PASNO
MYDASCEWAYAKINVVVVVDMAGPARPKILLVTIISWHISLAEYAPASAQEATRSNYVAETGSSRHRSQRRPGVGELGRRPGASSAGTPADETSSLFSLGNRHPNVSDSEDVSDRDDQKHAAAHLGLQLVERIDKHVVGFLQPHELTNHQLEVRRVGAGPNLKEPRQAVRAELRQAGQSDRPIHRHADPAAPDVAVGHVDGARLREEGDGGGAVAARHALRPRQERVVDERADGAALRSLVPEEVGQRGGARGLEAGQVGGDVAALAEAAAVESVRDGGEADRRARGGVGRAGGEDEAGDGQRGAQAVERQALGELEHGVDVALARVRQEQHVAAGLHLVVQLAGVGVGVHGWRLAAE